MKPLPTWKSRYQNAHRAHQLRLTPSAVKDHGYLETKFPKIDTSNGLTLFIVNFINWSGYRANRISVLGRQITKTIKSESGGTFTDSFFIPTGNKGQADVGSTIKGLSCQFEIKVGKDSPRPDQLKRQALERQAGGIYEFIHCPEEFLEVYDRIVAGMR
jgi:hypothetical protein